jgi:hypothetical protein
MPEKIPEKRTEYWLNTRLEQIWQLLYPEVPRKNEVKAVFKGKWKNKFGHIVKRGDFTEIAINSLFSNNIIPEYVIDTTLAHELTHYMHGFGSPLEKKYAHPHKGGIVTKELVKRGFGPSMSMEKKFCKTLWPAIYAFIKSASKDIPRDSLK